MALTISDLPLDLLREIVCRVGLTDMRAVRLTCKKWDTLSKSGSFRKMHMCNESARAEGETRMVALMDNNLHLIDVVVDDVDVSSTEIKGKLSCLDQQQLNIIKVFHCQGLLLCVLRDSFRLLVWNPYLGHTRWIEPPSYSRHGRRLGLGNCDMYRYALGYDHNKKSHKILRFFDDHIYKEGHFLCYEMYDFHSNLWRTLNVSIPDGWLIPFNQVGVPLNGNTYWLTGTSFFCHHLVCFDFTSEKFGPVLPLPPISEERPDTQALLSCLKGDKLTVLLQFLAPLQFHIWVTSVIDPTKVSWTKFLTGGVSDLYHGFSSMGLFIDEAKKLAMVFDSHTPHTLNIFREPGFFRQVYVDLPGDLTRSYLYAMDYTPLCSHYFPSLVQIQKPPLRVYKRRKQPTKLRLRQCDRNKSKSRLDDRLDDDDDEEHLPKRTRRT